MLSTLLRLGEGRTIKGLKGVADRVSALATAIEGLTDADLRSRTDKFKKRLAAGESLDALLPEAFAVAREAAWRVLSQRHFDVQVMGGAALHFGLDFRLHVAQSIDCGEIQITPVYERTQHVEQTPAGGGVTGHRARLQPGIALPVAAVLLQVLLERAEIRDQRAGVPEWPQPSIIAAFSIISTLLLMVIERGREIAVLKALGASGKRAQGASPSEASSTSPTSGPATGSCSRARRPGPRSRP